MPPKKKKELVRFRPRLQDERRRQNRFAAEEWASKLVERDKGSYYNQEKWLKDDKALKNPLKLPRREVVCCRFFQGSVEL